MASRVVIWTGPVLGATLVAILGGWYLHLMLCPPLEALRLLLGLLLLWGPAGVLLYTLLPAAVEHRGCRFALAWGGSYTLTTLLYFGCAVLGLNVLFYILQGAAVVAAVVVLRRTQRAPSNPSAAPWGGLDWVLIVLIGFTLVQNIRYQVPFETRETDGQTSYIYRLSYDQLYYAGQAYQLDRHIPPEQSSIRGGSAERAYHNFPHITTMLLARYTHQHDMLRAQVFYHYTVIEILLCLCLFGIIRTVTGARWPAYAAILFMYILVFESKPIKTNHIHWYYFTWFPHASSGLMPTAGTSPQMYSGIVVFFTILLDLALFCKARTVGRPIGLLACLVTVMTVATLRFRIHIFLALFPLLLLGLARLWWLTRTWVPPVLAVVAVLLSLLLYEEMQGPAYLPQTARLRIGYNGLTEPGIFINEWPMSQTAHGWVDDISDDPDTRKWLWQVVSMTCFSLFNVVGIPLLVATVLVLRSPRMREQYGWLLSALVAMTVLSIAGGILLTTDYDKFSVGGQMLFHTHWYLFPLLSIPMWLAYRHLRDNWRCPAWIPGVGAVLVVGWMLHAQMAQAHHSWFNRPFTLNSDERLVLFYLHETAPANAVILTNHNLDNKQVFTVSGLTGRAAYLEAPGNPVDKWANKRNPDDDRLKHIKELWTLHDPAQFRESLRQTHATLLVEYADSPLVVEGGRPGLTPIWCSPHHFVNVYRIDQ